MFMIFRAIISLYIEPFCTTGKENEEENETLDPMIK